MQTDDELFLVMEYVSGDSLARLLEQARALDAVRALDGLPQVEVLEGALALIAIPVGGTRLPVVLPGFLAPCLGNGPDGPGRSLAIGRAGHDVAVGFDEGAVGTQVTVMLKATEPFVGFAGEPVVGF